MSSSPRRLMVDARVRAAWQEQVAVAIKTPGLVPALLRQRQALLPRFAACYTQLQALPRRVRRALQRKWKQSLAGLALLLALGQEPVLAATITVSGGCSLINAITAANTDTATGGCPQGNGADTLVLANSSVHTLTAVNNSSPYGPTGLPVISSVITIEGNNSTIRRGSGAPEFRIFAVNSSGDLTLNETTVSGGIAPGDVSPSNLGGGVLNDGTLTLTDTTLSGNTASYGGGVSNEGTLTITYSTLSGNSAGGPCTAPFNCLLIGGGGGVHNSGTLTITDSTLSGNTARSAYCYFNCFYAGKGGGVYNDVDGTLTITHSTLSGNSAAIEGGGVHNSGTLTITDSTLSGNLDRGVSNDGTLTITDSTLSGNLDGGVSNGGTLTITDSTISGNSGSGGVSNGGTLTITNSTISGNTAGDGGGVSNGGTLTITNSTLSGNSAYDRGGGVYNDFDGTLTIQNSTLSGNAAFVSGGVYNGDGTLTITHSTLSGNSASYCGGVYNDVDGTLTITHSTISGNSTSFRGGGVENRGTLTLTHSTLSGNSASDRGGGVLNSGTLTLTHSTLSGNSTGGGGGGVFNNYDATLTLAHTLVSGNTAPNSPEISNSPGTPYIPPGTVVADAFNLFGHDGDAGIGGFSLGATDIVPTVSLNAILDTNLADNGGPTLTHALVSGSPAIDAVASGCPPPATDQRGFLRPADGDTTPGALCDIGAFEFAALPLVVLNDFVTFDPLPSTFTTTTDPTGCPPGFVGTFSFTARLTDKSTSPPLSDLTVEVDTLTNGNLLQNADGGPGGVGATLTVAEQGPLADGVLSAGEAVDVPFVICLQQRGPFTFFVDVLGVEQE